MNRLLTTSERFFLNLADQLVVNIVIVVRFRGQVPVERVREALDRCQQRHPGLRVRVVKGAKPWFCTHAVPPIPLRVVERRGPEHWRELVEREQNTPIDVETGPLARFTLVRDSDDEGDCELVFTGDHLNADGHSVLALFRDLLDLIDDPTRRLVPLPERTSFEDHLPRGPFDLVGVPAPYKNMLADRARELGQRLTARAQPRTAALPRVRFITRQLDHQRSAALLEACREAGATVYNTMLVACAHALGQTRSHHRRSKSSLVACTTPINIRAQLDPPVGDDYGVYAWSPISVHRIEPGDNFWARARKANEIVSAYRRPANLTIARGLRDMLEITEGLGIDPALTAKTARGFFDANFIISNLGRLNLREAVAGAEVAAFDVFAFMPHIDCMMVIYSFRGQLRITYCCSPSWSGPGIISRVADGVEAIVDAAIGRGGRGIATQLGYAREVDAELRGRSQPSVGPRAPGIPPFWRQR